MVNSRFELINSMQSMKRLHYGDEKFWVNCSIVINIVLISSFWPIPILGFLI